MVLILSENGDVSTDKVIEWLIYYNIKYLRINENINILDACHLKNDISQVYFEIENKTFNLNDIGFVWFRRGGLILKSYFEVQHPENTLTFKRNIDYHLKNESDTLKKYIHYLLSKIPSLNNPEQYDANKLIVLETAKKCNLKIPDTIICKRGSDLISFSENNSGLITKCIQDGLKINSMNVQPTLKVSFPININDTFYYSLFQTEIKKQYELRIFYIDGAFFSSAIFPDPDDHIDGRNLDHLSGIQKKIVPYKLPLTIEKKITRLMKILKLNCGSIDMIVNESGDYYFLEVNPVGQFNYVSAICNYNIEKHIAEHIINHMK